VEQLGKYHRLLRCRIDESSRGASIVDKAHRAIRDATKQIAKRAEGRNVTDGFVTPHQRR
jgi:hypothetical protein